MIDALAFSPDGGTLAVSGCNLACRLLDSATGERLWTVRTRCGFGRSVAFTPDGSVLCRGAALSTRSAADGTEMRKCGGWCRAFGTTRDGRTAFVADVKYRDIIRGYDVSSGKRRAEVELETGTINRIVASPDRKRVAVVGCRRFHLLASDTLAILASDTQRSLANGAFALAFSPCGRTLIYTAGRTLFVWDVAKARETKRFHLDTKPFRDAVFTPCGRRLITASTDGTARVWDTADWTCERTLAWKVGPLCAVAISPDGHRAACGSDTGRVVVWDLE